MGSAGFGAGACAGSARILVSSLLLLQLLACRGGGGGWSRSLQNPAAFPLSTWLLWSSPRSSSCTFLTLGMGDEAWLQLSR